MPVAIRFIFASLGLLVCVACLWLRRMNSSAQNWPSTDGRIMASALRSDSDGDTSVEIRYEYTVAGRTYTSDRVAFAVFRNDLPAKAQLVARFPIGAMVPVYYDPQNPKTAALIRSSSSLWFWGAVSGLASIAIAILVP